MGLGGGGGGGLGGAGGLAKTTKSEKITWNLTTALNIFFWSCKFQTLTSKSKFIHNTIVSHIGGIL